MDPGCSHKMEQLLLNGELSPGAAVASDRSPFRPRSHKGVKALPGSEDWPVGPAGGTEAGSQALWGSTDYRYTTPTGEGPPEVHTEQIIWLCSSQLFPNNCRRASGIKMDQRDFIQQGWSQCLSLLLPSTPGLFSFYTIMVCYVSTCFSILITTCCFTSFFLIFS